MASNEDTASLAQYDLTSKFTPFLDKHLCIQILAFLENDLKIYNPVDVKKAQLHIIKDTNMLDLAIEIYQSIGEEVPEEMATKREAIVERIQAQGDAELGLLQLLEDAEAVKRMGSLKSVTEVCEQFSVTIDQIEGLVTYAKLQYECGNYQISSELLKHYRSLMIDKDSERVMTSKNVSCIWGSLASLILGQDFDGSAEAMASLDEYLQNAKMPKREVLLQRTWLVHWSLFPLFKSANAPFKALDIFLHDRSISVMSLSCPYLFRYAAACLILHKRLKLMMKDIVRIINLEKDNYSDPITRFLVCLYTDLDFDGAQLELQECRKVCKADFFLAPHWEDFEENARLLIFETYCRIHQCINIDMIASKLNMTPADAELWIVKLIQNAKLDARIDSEKSRVVMSKAPPSVYQQVIEKTKNLSFRSTMLLSNLEKRENEKKGMAF
jgi:translation initiation factor 3 subunit E